MGHSMPPDDAPHPAELHDVPPLTVGSSVALTSPGETASSAIAAREKASVEAKFLVAIGRPRKFELARAKILEACRRPRFAERVQYRKPIGQGKSIQGLSIRFAEEVARHWGNIDLTAMIVFDSVERRITRVMGVDLETNTSHAQDVIVEKLVERRQLKAGQQAISQRKNSTGQTTYLVEATEDEILTKTNAMIAKARRNIILALIPSDICEEAEEIARTTLQNQDAKDPAAAKKAILDAFWGVGVGPEQVSALLGGKSIDRINPAELQLLRTIFAGIRDGETTYDAVMEELGNKKPEPSGDAKPGRPSALQKIVDAAGGEPKTWAGEMSGAAESVTKEGA